MLEFERLGQATAYVAHARLNNPSALNALNLDMCDGLLAWLHDCENDSYCKGLLISGDGGRAFCAGGDVKYATQNPPELASHYFDTEYTLDEALHRTDKPLVIWGHGIVMGGGMGLLQAADIRLVSDKTLMSMPETAIGLYPDVGANWFMNRTTQDLGRLLCVAGAHMDGADALYLNLADHLIDHNLFDRLKTALSEIEWLGDDRANLGQIQHAIRTLAPALPALEHSQVYLNLQTLLAIRDLPTLWHQVEALKNLSEHGNPWLAKLGVNAKKGSPLSQVMTDAYIARHKHSSLHECFNADRHMSRLFAEHGEFAEGVRAVLIDKDQAPNWAYTDIRDVPEAMVNEWVK